MTNLMKKGFSGLFSRKPVEVNASSSTGFSGVGVKSLSRVTQGLSGAETVKTLSFWICFIVCASLIADLMALLAEKYLPTPAISRLASRSHTGTFSGPMNYDIISDRNLFSSKVQKIGGE